MKTRLSLIFAAIMVALTGVAFASSTNQKVFVCKYVGTPNVDERLQTGNNPISVSVNAIANYQGVGSSFNDAQGRSLVVAIDTGQDEPECPAPTTPPVTPPVVIPPKTDTPPKTETPPTILPEVGASGSDEPPLDFQGK